MFTEARFQGLEDEVPAEVLQILRIFFNYMFVLLVLETHTTSSQDGPPVMNRTHDTFTQCVQRKNDIQETFEKFYKGKHPDYHRLLRG